ncbi:MAG: hypothetical protein IJB86_02305 [Clostridia bacterium]|nr:hypothetical protein [Clostridia bacterium]
MKKFISVLLSVIMAFSVLPVMCFAAEEDANENLPMIFVTGIGQTFSFMENEDGSDTFPYKYTDENGEMKERIIPFNNRGNILNFDIDLVLDNLFSNPKATIKALGVIGQILLSLVLNTYVISNKNFAEVARELFYLNIPDENGKLPEEVVTPFYTYPVSQYNEDAKDRFDRTVPHPELIEAYGKDRVFCFNYVPFGSIENLADSLNDYINNVQTKYFPGKKVILVPMSMGAATVSRYLYKYGAEGDVAKVISVVGCWDGSDVFADLVEGKYADNSADIFYGELLESLLGDDVTVSLVKIVLRMLSKKRLTTPLVRNLVKILCDEVILRSSTMVALIPSDRYKAIRDVYLTRPGYEKVLADADKYYEAQSSLKTTLRNLEETVGTEFYFISGYGLPFGSVTTDYAFFKCFETAGTTNSDEIIQIESTTIGATAVAAGTQFSKDYLDKAEENGTAKYISPDKSVDLSTAAFPDRCFLFYQQKHELEYNNVAIDTVLEIAKGNVKDAYHDPENYPQFNGFRNLKNYNGYVEFATNIINDEIAFDDGTDRKYSDILGEAYADVKTEAEGFMTRYNTMKATTVIDVESDAKLLEDFEEFRTQTLRKLGVETEEKANPVKDFFENGIIKFSDFLESITGPKGLPDLIF